MSYLRLARKVRREILEPEESNTHAIDGLRGLAIVTVVLFHCALFLGFLTRPGLYEDSQPWIVFLARNGWSGVTIFFVISGFLIGSILIKEIHHEKRLYFASFFIKRSFRIFPAYYLVITISLFLIAPLGLPAFNFMYSTGNWQELFSGSWASYLYVQNYVNPGHEPSILSWGWSLSVEEQFYVLIPPTLLLIFKSTSERVRLFAVVGLVCLPVIARTAHYLADPNLTILKGFYYYSHNRFDEILVGVVIAYFHVVYPAQLRRICGLWGNWLGVAGLIGFIVVWSYGSVFRSNLFTVVFQFLVMALSTGLILLNCLYRPNLLTRFFSHRFWYPVARVSYGIYLIHPFVLFGLMQLFAGHINFTKSSAFGLFLIYLAVLSITWVLSAIMFLMLERPMLVMGAKLAKKSRPDRLEAGTPKRSATM
ncbi:MAG: acyltransferase [Halioglobus sp.]